MLVMSKYNNITLDAETSLLSAKFSLSPLEAKFLRILLVKLEAGKKDLPELGYSVRQVIYTLRKKLEKLEGVYIVNNGKSRYSIPRRSKERIWAEVKDDL